MSFSVFYERILQNHTGKGLGRKTPPLWKISPPQSNRKGWRQRTATRLITRLKQFHYKSALSTRRASAPLAHPAARAFAPTIRHPEPTGATTDGAVPADKLHQLGL